MLTVAARTHPGAVRTINEDAVLWDPGLGLMVVADGMGGHNAGEVASHLAVDTLHAFVKMSADGDDFTWPFGVNPQWSFAANRLLTALKIANRRVYRESEVNADYTGMGTTVVAAIADGANVTFASIGDSRMYSLRGAELEQLTVDDSWVVMLQKESGRDARAFERHPMRHVLTSVVGARPEVDAPVHELEMVNGQTLMLCTDGLHGGLPDQTIRSILQAESDLERAANTLVEAAVSRDGSDNVTILLARYSG
jgi:serine/threonine protein phosphatase PrpC